MSAKVKWGIIATGGIAQKFAKAIKQSTNGEVYAVCSRSLNKAKEFIANNGGIKAYDSEKTLAEDPEVDIVYVANPHPYHYQSALTCLNAGKAVLCEKPITINEAQLASLIAAARKNKVYLMEAMWARFNPTTRKLCELLKAGAIGDIRMATVHFGFRARYDETNRFYNPDLGGGALFDVGIYSLSFCSMILGTPIRVQSTCNIGGTKVDEQCGFLLDYADGAFITATASIEAWTNQDAWIFGTKGRIQLVGPMHSSHQLRLIRNTTEADNSGITQEIEEIFTFDFEGEGYHFEAEAVAADILAGRLENELMPLAESLAIAHTMNEARKDWGLFYPGESK